MVRVVLMSAGKDAQHAACPMRDAPRLCKSKPAALGVTSLSCPRWYTSICLMHVIRSNASCDCAYSPLSRGRLGLGVHAALYIRDWVRGDQLRMMHTCRHNGISSQVKRHPRGIIKSSSPALLSCNQRTVKAGALDSGTPCILVTNGKILRPLVSSILSVWHLGDQPARCR